MFFLYMPRTNYGFILGCLKHKYLLSPLQIQVVSDLEWKKYRDQLWVFLSNYFLDKQMQPQKAELVSDEVPAEMLEGACIGSGVVPLLSSWSWAHRASLCLDLVTVSVTSPTFHPVLCKPSEVVGLGMVSRAGAWGLKSVSAQRSSICYWFVVFYFAYICFIESETLKMFSFIPLGNYAFDHYICI